MNVYDFDKTIFYPDSSYCFVIHCLRHYPRAVLRAMPAAAVYGLLHLAGLRDTKAMKEKIFSFLPELDDVDRIVAEFWQAHRSGIGEWYLARKREDDLIISASPAFLLQPLAEELGVRLIATPMDKRTGQIMGRNCHDQEKLTRFLKEYPGERVECFYSDSLSDSPMAWKAEHAYLVDRGSLSPWPERHK